MSEVTAPTWGQQLREEHRELRRKVSDMRDYLNLPRPEPGETGAHTWAAGLSQRLMTLHDELFRHFRFEDEGGLVEDIALRHPHGVNAAEQLVSEHKEFLIEARRLMDESLTYSEGRQPEDLTLRKQTIALLDRLHKHEMAETAMIQRLEYQDIGTGD